MSSQIGYWLYIRRLLDPGFGIKVRLLGRGMWFTGPPGIQFDLYLWRRGFRAKLLFGAKAWEHIHGSMDSSAKWQIKSGAACAHCEACRPDLHKPWTQFGVRLPARERTPEPNGSNP